MELDPVDTVVIIPGESPDRHGVAGKGVAVLRREEAHLCG
jgi:hypothetical protein